MATAAIRTILAASDFSVSSTEAVTQACALAERTGARLHLIHASSLTGAQADHYELTARRLESYRREARRRVAEATERLAEIAETIAERGIQVTHAVVDGHADSAIVREAAEFPADLIVLGAHRGSRFLQLGGTAERVVRRSERNVMVVRRPPAKGAAFRRILVAVDFTVSSHKALEQALELAAADATVHLLHCWHKYPLIGDSIGGPMGIAGGAGDHELCEILRGELRQRGEALVKAAVGGRDDAGAGRPSVTFFERQDSASHGILEVANTAEPRYDLVAVGSHGRRGFQRLLLGSVAETTARYAPTTVLVAHAPTAEPH